ncbi:SDR family NAD(P)-dependent oxidoreductase [Pacificibacter marinus]|uniref:3-oxoacyl-[acyl-carrier-protein] reductase FabG n=1 Tax=Pacificibacter marinus TaxID=658057 RepID=A0A1Y5T9V2_9RHOB|nr:SDR family NAD(P)-dependent oxidoreductase [Pacificibacter marinus]SEL09393.1 NAD(P)-dependent dehydrogenase, short-chain alcohol dehydrogenase family [Pacificibacter marinus]SLN58921.1 3-oxoacyl-[acyl-carrier-protein] reductase FabG [Pacificibacter marinus]
MTLSGKTAFVTGGGSGVGAVIALMLADAGAQVTICGRRLAPLETVAAKHNAISAVVADITDEAAISKAIADCAPDIVIANAGASESAPFAKTELAAFERMMSVNVTGTFLTLREGTKAMKDKPWGRLIAIASTAGLKGYPYVAPYAAAKHAVVGMVKSVALELVRKGITVNAICPGFLDTEMTQRSIANIVEKTGRSPEDARASLEATNPMHKLVPPEDVAKTVLWLCGEGSDMITGQSISVSGGET